MGKTERLQVRMSKTEKELIEKAADILGISASEFARGRLLDISRNVLLKAEGKLDTETVLVLDANRTSQLVLSITE